MIRPATAADLDAIDEIERHSFKTPWPRATFEGELAREWAHLDVLEDHDAGRARVVAFCNYWLVAPSGAQRRVRDDGGAPEGGEVNILAIATHPDHRGRGHGARVLAHVLAFARSATCTLATLEVRRSNVPALALYTRAGFTTIHTRPRYYQDSEDALVMSLELS